MPATIRFWKMITASTSGIVITTEAALIVPSGISNFWLPVKFATATGTVNALGELRERLRQQELVPDEEGGQEARCHEAGAASGSTTLRNAWK